MIWEDERYVRIYTRDTATLLRLGWEGRAVLWELTRKVDRAGILRVEEPVADLAAILRMPEDVVERGLTALMSGKSPTVLLQEGAVVIPKFLEAQEARQSDRQRKADQRAKARDVAAARSVVADETEPHAVTKRDSESQNVTDCPPDGQKVTTGHTESHAVTSGHSVPYRTVPDRTLFTEPPPAPSVDFELAPPNEPPKPKRQRPEPSSEHQRFCDLWTEAYEARYGARPTWGTKQGAIVQRLLKRHGFDRIAERAKQVLRDPPAWITGSVDIGFFEAQFDKLATAGPRSAAVDEAAREREILRIAEERRRKQASWNTEEHDGAA